jgi:hypothetical protein
MRRTQLIAIPVALLLAGCSGQDVRECALPPLAESEVVRIGREYLDSKDIVASFRAQAEVRVTAVGCHYEYEEAEKLDSFGVGFVVEVDRSGAVRDFYSSE